MTYCIALVGAQGTGKSTVAKELAAAFRRDGFEVRVYERLGDRAISSGIATGTRALGDDVRHFIEQHQLREATIAGPIAILDRCLVDALAYATVLNCLSDAESEALRSQAVVSSNRIEQLVWLRVTQDYPATNPIDEPWTFRCAIDEAIGTLARKNDIRLYEHAIPPEDSSRVVEAILARFRASREL